MTLIVGILCDGGVAIASDRQATQIAFVPLAVQPLAQSSTAEITKVTKIGSDTLFGVSGLPAIGTEYEETIRAHQARFANHHYELATKKLKEEIRKLINAHLETAKLAAYTATAQQVYGQATCECLLAASFKDGPRLIQILRQGAFDIATAELPLRAIGSGQLHADPFLMFLKNTFWPNRLPTVQEGVLAACWAIDYAIEVGAPMVGKDINAYSLANDGRTMKAKEETAEHIKIHRNFIEGARQRLREHSDIYHTAPAEAKQVPTMGTENT